MPTPPLLDAFLIAAQRQRLMDAPARKHLADALRALPLQTPQALDEWLRENPLLPSEIRFKLRQLLPSEALWNDYLPYRPLALLTRGGAGVIWLSSTKDGELIVIKTLRGEMAPIEGQVEIDADGDVWINQGSGSTSANQEASPDTELHRRLEREVKIMRQLNHPSLVRCLDHGITRSGHLFMVLEYLACGDLAEYIARHGQLSDELVLSLMNQIAAGLEVSHQLNLVHRDIKPGNIFLESDGRAKLADFGFARSTLSGRTQLTSTGAVVGSPSYMSPEQVDGRDDLDIRADIYALGCVMHHALSGAPPFSGTAQEVLHQHRTAAPPALETLRSGTHPAVSAIVATCLAKHRNQRYANPTAFRNAVIEAIRALGLMPGRIVPLVQGTADESSTKAPTTVSAVDAAAPTGATAATAAPVNLSPATPASASSAGATPTPPAAAPARSRDTEVTVPDYQPQPKADGGTPRPSSVNLVRGLDADFLVLRETGGEGLIALFARNRIIFGKLRDESVDLCLRNYPDTEFRDECLRVSRQHGACFLDQAGNVVLQDLGSANGTTVDGTPLTPGRPSALHADHEHVIEVANVITLRGRLVARRHDRLPPGYKPRSAKWDAFLLLRTKNRPSLTYALVFGALSIGGRNADIALPGAGSVPTAWLAYGDFGWRFRPTDAGEWLPLLPDTSLTIGGRTWRAEVGQAKAF